MIALASMLEVYDTPSVCRKLYWAYDRILLRSRDYQLHGIYEVSKPTPKPCPWHVHMGPRVHGGPFAVVGTARSAIITRAWRSEIEGT
jgi:hypothetical protein